MKSEASGAGLISAEEMGERIVGLLVVVMGISVFLLWTLNPLTKVGQDAFAIYLAVDFVAFAMVSYLYRALDSGGEYSRFLIVAGCSVIAILFFLSFTLPG